MGGVKNHLVKEEKSQKDPKSKVDISNNLSSPISF